MSSAFAKGPLLLSRWLLLGAITFPLLCFASTAPHSVQKKRKRTPTVKTLPKPNDRYALIIGVEAYDDASSITSIRGPNNDAIEISRALKSYAGFPEGNVTVLASNLGEAMQPTATNIYTKLAELVSYVPKEGLLVIAFSGHGIEVDGHTFLLPKDARLRGGNKALLEATSIDIPRIKRIMGEGSIKQILILLDSCREDPSASKGLGDNNLTSTTVESFDFDSVNRDVEAFAVIFATGIGKRSYIIPEKLQGYFSSALVEGLTGKARNENNVVTLSSLIKYLQTTVPNLVRRDLKQEQKPWARVEGYNANELVLAGIGLAESVPQVIPDSPTSDSRTENLAAEAARHSELGSQHFTNANKSGDWQKFDKGMYEALLEYRIAESMQPEVAIYRINAGAALSRLGRYDEAVVKFREGIKLGPTKPWFHNELCVALKRLKHYDEADTECIKAVRDVNNRTFQDELEKSFDQAERARLAGRSDGVVLDFSVVDTATAQGHSAAAAPYLNDYGISISELAPRNSRVVIVNNVALYGGTSAHPTSSQNFLTQINTDSSAASFKLLLNEPCQSVTFTRPALLAATKSGITHPAWSAHALDAEGRELSSQGESLTRSFSDLPARTFTLIAPGLNRIAALRFDSDPRLNGKPFSAFPTILIERFVMKCKETE